MEFSRLFTNSLYLALVLKRWMGDNGRLAAWRGLWQPNYLANWQNAHPAWLETKKPSRVPNPFYDWRVNPFQPSLPSPTHSRRIIAGFLGVMNVIGSKPIAGF